MMTKILLPVFLSLGFLALAAGWLLAGYAPLSLSLVLLLALALFLLKRKFPLTLNLSLALLVVAAGFGLWKGVNFPLTLGGVLCVLTAWDLHDFSRRLAFAADEDGPQQIERQHLLQLGLILGIGLGISIASLFIRIVLNFEWVALLSVVTFAGIGALISRLRNKEN